MKKLASLIFCLAVVFAIGGIVGCPSTPAPKKGAAAKDAAAKDAAAKDAPAKDAKDGKKDAK